MKFDQFQAISAAMFALKDGEGTPVPRFGGLMPGQLPPLVLAYVGDAFFTLFVRVRLLSFERDRVRVLHSFDSRMVSAPLQAHALRSIEPMLTETELGIVRRGRNTSSRVPRSATVGEYRASTGFESLLGYLYLAGEADRLEKLASAAFAAISREMTKFDK